jgi:UDPglucose--hexose-1-phosphate uridylyltransferase
LTDGSAPSGIAAATGEVARVDVHTDRVMYVVAARQGRPNLPASVCPFCPGGLEAPDAYDVRWFPNRWPAMPGNRCEVVLYTPGHDATFWSLGLDRALRVVELWTERTAVLGARPDVAYVLVFENRGAEVGATISHPHGQIYAFDVVPEQPLRELKHGNRFSEPGTRLVAAVPGWQAWVPEAPIFPYTLLVVPDDPVADLPALGSSEREGLARILIDLLERLDRLFDAETPYMLWIHQRPFDGQEWPQARLHVEIVSPWRATGVPRYIAAGELGSGVYFNPVPPEEAARSLREALDR